MSSIQLRLKQITKFGLILMMGASMSACSGDQKWKEEVLLSDGRVIVVEREMIVEAGGGEWASNRSLTKPKEYRIRFEYPDGSGKMIEWRSIKKSPQTWPEVPLIFDMVSGRPVVFSIVPISARQEVYSEYTYRNGVWIEDALPEHFEPRIANLLFGSQRDLPSLLSLEEKRKRNSQVGYRRSLKQVGPNRQITLAE